MFGLESITCSLSLAVYLSMYLRLFTDISKFIAHLPS